MTFNATIQKHGLTLLLLVTAISVTVTNFNHERWRNGDVIKHDVVSYYSYLPAFFYHQDLSLSFLEDSLPVGSVGSYLPAYTKDWKPVIKTTMGMAFFYLPFFASAHLYTKAQGTESNGFSEPFHAAIQFSSLFYYLIALVLLWRILKQFFTPAIVFVTLLSLTFGTNVFYYLTIGAGMSHIVGLFLISAFTFFTIRWYERQTYRSALVLGFLFGLLLLVRPTNGLIALFFVLYRLEPSALSKRPGLIKNNFVQICLLVFTAFLVLLPQLLYWKSVTGQYLFNSYIGEQFYFEHPHILEGLFGFRKGFFVYTPLMLFVLVGLFLHPKQFRNLMLPVALTMVIYCFVIFSWWCWWYGGSFGSRPMIDMYPLLLFPLAAFFQYVSERSQRAARLTIGVFTGFFIVLNLFQTAQAKWNIIHYDSMTLKSYLNVFARIPDEEERKMYLDAPDYEGAVKPGKER